jgi:methylated-DNA-[protein]-cysteine S-methyltransferase
MSNLKDELDQALDTLYSAGLPEDTLKAAQQRLLKTMEQVLPPLAFYGLIPDTIIGDVWVAVGEDGLVAIDFDLSEGEFVKHVMEKVHVRLERNEKEIKEVLKQVKDYLQGKLKKLNLKIDLHAVTPFQRFVLQAAREVPRGQVATYAEIAKKIGKPKACRAVGQALRRNPIPIVIPCHRVIASDGTLGGYGGKMGSQRKITLLRLEGVILT